MRHEINETDRRKVEVALRKISEVIGLEYPESMSSAEPPEVEFRWGQGVGFRLALRAVVDAALPGWEDGT